MVCGWIELCSPTETGCRVQIFGVEPVLFCVDRRQLGWDDDQGHLLCGVGNVPPGGDLRVDPGYAGEMTSFG